MNIPSENIHIPDGSIPQEQIDEYCRSYEQAIVDAGGIDIQILGIGRTGHIGFNEPGSDQNSQTRLVQLDRVTRMDAASDFFGIEYVPDQAITMGIKSITSARCVCLLAFGEHKSQIVQKSTEEPISRYVAASFLQDHGDSTFYVDSAAAALLTRIATPWLVGQCEWDQLLTRRAVIWLSLKVKKAILALTDEDYAENQLQGLLKARGRAYDINLEVFRKMMNTISGWPAGKKPGKRVLIFSPHPDDDVISMGATLVKLAEQGHDVHIAYQTSGNIAVFDHAVLREANFVSQFNAIFGLASEQTRLIDKHIHEFLRDKTPASIDSPEVQAVKTLIRKTEAIAAAGYSGIAKEKCHFLDMPFYKTGMVQKLPISDQDVNVTLDILKQVQPEIVFAAGDLSDPHGTHRMCLQAVFKALKQYQQETPEMPEVWLYRGAWQEWEPHQIDMAVPVSPDEFYHKRHAIFRHEIDKG